MKVTKGTIIRTICLIVALLNMILQMFGKSPLPIENETISEVVSGLAVIITSIIAWWKNNSFTPEALKADDVKNELKGKTKGE